MLPEHEYVKNCLGFFSLSTSCSMWGSADLTVCASLKVGGQRKRGNMAESRRSVYRYLVGMDLDKLSSSDKKKQSQFSAAFLVLLLPQAKNKYMFGWLDGEKLTTETQKATWLGRTVDTNLAQTTETNLDLYCRNRNGKHTEHFVSHFWTLLSHWSCRMM